MKVPLSWLKEYLNFTQSPEELAEVLTLAGIEVEGIDITHSADVIFDVSLTPNLGHCMSILGLARDVSAQLGIPLKSKEFKALSEEGEPIEKLIQIQLIDKKQCPRYACRAVMGVRVGPSPEWLKEKVEACGVRSINNAVDIGNLVMLELGQPLHLFDYDKIDGKKIIITAQTDYKEMETLDGAKRPIPPESLLICDAAKPLAFAGVMGGKATAVDNHSVNILIEAAYFSPQSIRKTAKLIGLKSDSSQRFERGIDPNAVVRALDYAAYLLQNVAGGKIAKGAVDQKACDFPEKKINCRTERVNKVIGVHLSVNEIAGLLDRLGISVVEEKPQEQLVSVPTYRNDICIEVDLIEEIARVYGYNNIPKPIPEHVSSTIPNAPLYELEKDVRRRLVGEGLQELMTCDLISPAQAEMTLENAMNRDALITVLHSHSVDQSVLRTTLLPGLLQAMKYNFDHGSPNIAGFEVGRVHFKKGDQYFEPSTAAIILSGKRSPYHWELKPREFNFFDLKGIVENLFAGLKIEQIEFEVSHLHNFHPGRQAKIKKAGAILGVMGEVHPDRAEQIDVPQRIFFAELNVNELMPFIPKQWKVADLSPFPGSERDWTVTLDQSLPIEVILAAVRAVPSRLLEKVTLLDLYKSEQIGKDKKNATFRFFYRDTEKTVAFETVEEEHARIIAAFKLV